MLLKNYNANVSWFSDIYQPQIFILIHFDFLVKGLKLRIQVQ